MKGMKKKIWDGCERITVKPRLILRTVFPLCVFVYNYNTQHLDHQLLIKEITSMFKDLDHPLIAREIAITPNNIYTTTSLGSIA